MPHDGAAQMRWCQLDGNGYVEHLFLKQLDKRTDVTKCEAPPVKKCDFLGQIRNCQWSIDKTDGETDAAGWQYSGDFRINDWNAVCGPFCYVRRRCWKPTFYAKELGEDEINERRPERLPSTLLKGKGLWQTKREIFDADLGAITLEALAKTLEADDWKHPRSLMGSYFREMGVTEMEIQPWSCGHSHKTKVEGKMRSIDFRCPVPPAHMCPKDTRVQSTWHLAVLNNRIVLESSSMSLDVPCGTSFNAVACDTFTVKDGRMKMVRTCGVEWVQSTWMKMPVEANVPLELAKVGQKFANLIMAWAVENQSQSGVGRTTSAKGMSRVDAPTESLSGKRRL